MYKEIDEGEVERLYVTELMTLRMVAETLGTDHHRVKRILISRNIPVSQKNRKRKPFTQQHRQAISKSNTGNACWAAGLTMNEKARRNNQAAKMKLDFSLDKYSDFDKLKFLTYYLSDNSNIFNTNRLKEEFLDKFYFDEQLNYLYTKWKWSGSNKWYRPSLDHKIPTSRGGDFSLDNLQFITWFENRAKAEMTMVEWLAFRRLTNTESDLFYDSK